MFDDVDNDIESGLPPNDTNNRTFLIAVGILGAITVLALVCMAVYAVWWVPQRRTAEQEAVAQIETQNALDVLSMTQTAQASRNTPTQPPTATSTNTPVPTRTPVVAVVTDTPTPLLAEQEADPRTATVAALLTQAAVQTQTVEPSPTTVPPTALPETGFADEFGVPGLVSMSFVLVAIIFLVRRMRTAAS